MEEICVKADLDTVIQFLNLRPALLKRPFSFSPEPVPNILQGKWVGRYTGQSQFKDWQQVIQDVLKAGGDK